VEAVRADGTGEATGGADQEEAGGEAEGEVDPVKDYLPEENQYSMKQ
jgi:hypothetical protein